MTVTLSFFNQPVYVYMCVCVQLSKYVVIEKDWKYVMHTNR